MIAHILLQRLGIKAGGYHLVELFLVLRLILFCAVVILLGRDQCLGGGLNTIYCLNSDLVTKAQFDNILQPSIKAVIVTL